MDDQTEYDDEDDEDYDTGPSLAIPPLYVLRTAAYCPACHEAMHIYTLGCAAFHDQEESRPTEAFHFLRVIESLPDSVLALLNTRCPGYHADTDGMHERPYLMNHCPCGAKFDDDYVTGDIGAAFRPYTPDGFSDIRLFLLPVEAPIPIVSSYSIGGDEYLDLANAPPW